MILLSSLPFLKSFLRGFSYRALFVGLALLGCAAQPLTLRAADFKASWITTTREDLTQPNTWHCFRKSVVVGTVPSQAITRIAVDSKYWLYINNKLVVYEGGLKRGPNPRDTYYDEIDIAPYLKKGRNTIAVLVWFWGGNGFSHKNSGRVGLLFDCQANGVDLLSSPSWKAQAHPAYVPATAPAPNFRLSEPNIKFDAQRDIANWYTINYPDAGWPAAFEVGKPPVAPWNDLYKRPIPMFKDYGIREYVQTVRRGDTLICTLPYDTHVSPIIALKAPAGKRVFMHTDTYYLGAISPTDSLYTLCSEYITKEGRQQYESLGWLSGHQVRYVLPKGSEVIKVSYRETGYATTFAGSFTSNDAFLNTLWKKAQRTLYVNMRDTYMDCPDRERAQWAGDGAMEMVQAFYALDTNSYALGRKMLLDLVNWQRPDGIVYNPVPEENWKIELPIHSLAPLGEYGAWQYFIHTGDMATIRQVYKSAQKYLAVWHVSAGGQLEYRKGGWDWGDWGENKDMILLQHGWYLLTLKGLAKMALVLNQRQDYEAYAQQIKNIKSYLNSSACWNGQAYRHINYKDATDDRANALMVLADVADSTKWEAIAQVYREQYHASPWMEKFVLESLFKMRKPTQALERMKRRFRPMVESPLTTLWEIWVHEPGTDKHKGNSGYNHGWAGGPLILMDQYMAGFSPSEEKQGDYWVLPQLAGLTAVQTTIPVREGTVQLTLRQENGAFSASLALPPATTCRLGIPKGQLPYDQIDCNQVVVWQQGKLVKDVEGLKYLDEDEHYYLFEVQGGKWAFKAQKIPEP